jgi:formate-dependent nitrite reductase membrane component NrfD
MTQPEWGLLIVIYLFLGGLSAGALVISGLANYLGRQERYNELARVGAWVAPFPVLLGTLLLVFDLGRPVMFWKLFFAFEPESPMWVGTWLLTLFSIVSLAYFNLFLPERLRLWKPVKAQLWKNILAAAGLPIGVGVGIYTGVLLGAVPARPFWNTPMVAQLFLFSALSTGAALMMILVPRFSTAPEAEEDRKLLVSADIIFILLELFIILPYIIHGELSTLSARTSLGLILGGPYTLVFWIGVIALGLLTPLLTEVIELAPTLARRSPFRPHRIIEIAAGVLVLLGGFLLRYVFVGAGQMSEFI